MAKQKLTYAQERAIQSMKTCGYEDIKITYPFGEDLVDPFVTVTFTFGGIMFTCTLLANGDIIDIQLI